MIMSSSFGKLHDIKSAIDDATRDIGSAVAIVHNVKQCLDAGMLGQEHFTVEDVSRQLGAVLEQLKKVCR